jgi:hypothetical protein
MVGCAILGLVFVRLLYRVSVQVFGWLAWLSDELMRAARLDGRDPDRWPVRAQYGLDVAAEVVRLA